MLLRSRWFPLGGRGRCRCCSASVWAVTAGPVAERSELTYEQRRRWIQHSAEHEQTEEIQTLNVFLETWTHEVNVIYGDQYQKSVQQLLVTLQIASCIRAKAAHLAKWPIFFSCDWVEAVEEFDITITRKRLTASFNNDTNWRGQESTLFRSIPNPL